MQAYVHPRILRRVCGGVGALGCLAAGLTARGEAVTNYVYVVNAVEIATNPVLWWGLQPWHWGFLLGFLVGGTCYAFRLVKKIGNAGGYEFSER